MTASSWEIGTRSIGLMPSDTACAAGMRRAGCVQRKGTRSRGWLGCKCGHLFLHLVPAAGRANHLVDFAETEHKVFKGFFTFGADKFKDRHSITPVQKVLAFRDFLHDTDNIDAQEVKKLQTTSSGVHEQF